MPRDSEALSWKVYVADQLQYVPDAADDAAVVMELWHVVLMQIVDFFVAVNLRNFVVADVAAAIAAIVPTFPAHPAMRICAADAAAAVVVAG